MFSEQDLKSLYDMLQSEEKQQLKDCIVLLFDMVGDLRRKYCQLKVEMEKLNVAGTKG